MSRLKLPNQKKAYSDHAQRLGKYMLQVVAVYDQMASTLSEKVLEAGYDGTVELLLRDYPELNKAVSQMQDDFVSSMNNIILSNTSKEWKESNLLQDLLAQKVWDYYEASHADKKYKHFFQTNGDALKAFQTRTENGMNLSKRLWLQSEDAKEELEACISTAIQKGMSAITLSKRVSQYLQDFPSMQKDYAEKFGHAASVKNCQYASIRLARSEINMAYRSAEQERWKEFDFVLGYEVKLSKSHPMPDICDDLKGKYPKDFKFLGWHPNCLCYVVPIVASDSEYWRNWNKYPMRTINSVPDEFKQWIRDNTDRIERAKERGTLPYFIRDNESLCDKYLRVKAPTIEFRQCKTLKECEEFARQFPFIGSVDYTKCTLSVANRLNKRLTELNALDMIPGDIGDKFNLVTFFSRKMADGSYVGGSYQPFSATHQMKVAWNSDIVRTRLTDIQFRKYIKQKMEWLAQLDRNLAKMKADVEDYASWHDEDDWIRRMRNNIARIEQMRPNYVAEIERAEKDFKPTYFNASRSVEDDLTHEFGHYVNNMLERQYGKFSSATHNSLKVLCDKYGYDAGPKGNWVWGPREHFLEKMAGTSEALKVSTYAATSGAEYFAECFSKYFQFGDCGNKELNDLFKTLFGR